MLRAYRVYNRIYEASVRDGKFSDSLLKPLCFKVI